MIAARFAQRVRDYRAGTLPYRPGAPDRCTACGQSHWMVGRTTAECGSCGNVRLIDRGRSSDGFGPVMTARGPHDASHKPVARQ